MMNKKAIAIAATAGIGVIVGGTLYILNKNKKHNVNTDMEENLNQIDDSVFVETTEDIIPDGNTDECNIDDDIIPLKFATYISKNGIVNHENTNVIEAVTVFTNICDIIERAKLYAPEYYQTIKRRIIEIMLNDFDMEVINKFYDEISTELYLNIDPCNVFIKNAFKILEFDPENQESILNLADELAKIQKEEPKRVESVIHEICDIFDVLHDEEIQESTYSVYFKEHVNRFCKTEDDDNTLESVEIDEGEVSSDETITEEVSDEKEVNSITEEE